MKSPMIVLSLIALSMSSMAHAGPKGTEFYVETQSPQVFDGSSLLPMALMQCQGTLQQVADECPGASADADSVQVLKSGGDTNVYADDASLIASIPQVVYTYRLAIKAGSVSCPRKTVRIIQLDSGEAPAVTTNYNCSLE